MSSTTCQAEVVVNLHVLEEPPDKTVARTVSESAIDLKVEMDLDEELSGDLLRTSDEIKEDEVPEEGVCLEWKELNVNGITPPSRISTVCCWKRPKLRIKSKPIIKNVSGYAEAGTFLAVLGVSGCGKTTLLNALSTRSCSDLEVEGLITVNGRSLGENIKSISSYISHDGLFVESLTVKEHLTFQAILRISSNFTTKEKKQRVDDVILQFQLSDCQNTLIGTPGQTNGISRGERQRLSYASEILTNPKLIFVDDPFSGLDWSSANSCLEILQNLTKQGKTVIAAVQRPPAEMTDIVDRILLMDEGRTAFHGTTEDCDGFFKKLGYSTPSNYNLLDYYIQVLADSSDSSNKICDEFASSSHSNSTPLITDYEKGDEVDYTLRCQTKFGAQSGMIKWRASKQFRRIPGLGRIGVIETVLTSLLIGLVFFQQPNTQESIQNKNSSMFYLLLFETIRNAMQMVIIYPNEMPLVIKEHKQGLYSCGAYFMGRQRIEVPYYVLTVILRTLIAYWMVGLNSKFVSFLKFIGVSQLNSQTTISFSMIISAMSSSTTMGASIIAPLLLPVLLLSGFFIDTRSIPPGISWLKYFSWYNYLLEVAYLNQWGDHGAISCPNNSTSCFHNGTEVIKHYGFNLDDYGQNIGCVFALLIGYRLIAYGMVVFRAHRTKV